MPTATATATATAATTTTPRRAAPRQLGLDLPPTHGGARRGAGRKPRVAGRAGVTHHGREGLTGREPVHVTLRCLDHVWNLRSRRAMAFIAPALTHAQRPGEFAIVHCSVQGNHLHLVVEARDARALAEGVQGFTVRVAKGLNRLMGRRGRVFADRYHAHVLRTPAEVRRALAYVLANRRSHLARLGQRTADEMDPYSSASAPHGLVPVCPAPRTWLLRTAGPAAPAGGRAGVHGS